MGQRTHSAQTNSGHIRFCLQPRAAHALRSDQHSREVLEDEVESYDVEKVKTSLLCLSVQLGKVLDLALLVYFSLV